MLSLSIAEIAEAVAGKIIRGDQGRIVSGAVQTDSREIVSGGIFFAKLGEKEDGHDYLADALVQGATLAIVSKPAEQSPSTRFLLKTQSRR